MKFALPKLNYSYDALEPYFDALTMEIHHTKHHQAYTDKMNAVLERYPDLNFSSAEEIMRNLAGLQMAEEDKKMFRNHGGGYINHKLFWENLDPQNQADQKLTEEINITFGSAEKFKEEFTKTAASHFGSGWTWLVKDQTGLLKVYSTANQDSPLLQGDQPLICLDLWEHAYYLKYRNRRPEYIANWWPVLKLI